VKKFAERVEFGVTDRAAQAYSNCLRDRRIHSGKDGDTSCDFFYGYRIIRVQAVAGLGAFASGVGFGHFHAARQIQINKTHL
jgi:hypothetical protein